MKTIQTKYGATHGGQDKLFIKYLGAPSKIGEKDCYMVYFKRAEFYQKFEPILFEEAETIYENEAGGIIKWNY